MNLNYLLAGGLLLLVSCSDSKKRKPNELVEQAPTAELAVQKDTFPLSKVIPVVACKRNPSLTYALYLPHQYLDRSRKLPALIFADPHGDGAFPISKYCQIAEKFGVILLGSNDSKNGLTFNQATPILQALADEAAGRLQAEARLVSLAGFSGGAKASLVAASETPNLLSVIYCGAGLTEVPQYLPPALAICGIRDMNYTDVILTDAQLEKYHVQHSLIEWKGKHEWADSSTFLNSFYWSAFRAMEKKIIPVDEKMVREFTGQNLKSGADPLLEEARLQRLIAFLGGVSDTSAYSASLTTLSRNENFIRAKKKQQDDFELESRMKQNYLKCMTQKDLLWWRDEVSRLKSIKSDPANDRIIGYISLACYSYSNNALKQQDRMGAQKFLSIYALADRENMDRAFMQACLYGQMNNTAGALESIREAIRYGFKDRSRLLSEPSFSSIRNSDDFRKLVQLLN